MLTDKKRNDIVALLVIGICFVLALLVFSCCTSPLFPHYYGVDSAIFSLLGKGILEGKQLYTELFDHKGPVIFLINAIGQFLGGRNGIFLLQCISGLICIMFLYYTGKMLRPDGAYRSPAEAVLLFLFVGSVLVFTAENGNLTEEYSLPVISCACYFFVKYATQASKNPKHPPVYAFAYGVGLAIMALLRLNNGVTIGAGILVIFIYLLYKKQYSNLLWNLLLGLLGMLVITIPVCLYFYMNSALDEMIYATFLHNFKIAGNTGRVPILQNPKLYLILYLPMLLSMLLIIMEIIRKRSLSLTDGLLAGVLCLNILCLWIANRYPHYFTIFIPVYYLVLCKYLRINWRSVMIVPIVICACCCICMTVLRTQDVITEVYINRNPYYTVVAEDMKKIPEQEKNSVIGYEIMAKDYLIGDVIPCYKYYTFQSGWAITSPQIVTDFMQWVEENEPLWILTPSEETGTDLDRILTDKYEFRFSNPYVYYYRLKE